MSESIVEFREVGKTYSGDVLKKPQTGLENFNLSLKERGTLGLLGANGAGKTTAIKILVGLTLPTTGSVRLFGHSPHSNTAKAKIGYLPERPYFPEQLTGNEFLNFHRNLYGRFLRADAPGNKELLKLVGLDGASDLSLASYSKGMLQRVGIAQSLLNSPDLLILDEPMSGLDPAGRYEIKQLIAKLARSGKTVLFSTHILSDAEELCDEIAFLERGRMKFSGSIDEILAKESLVEITFQGIDPEVMREHPVLGRAQAFGQSQKIRVTKENFSLRTAFEAIWQEQGRIINVESLHRSLEETLFGDLMKPREE